MTYRIEGTIRAHPDRCRFGHIVSVRINGEIYTVEEILSFMVGGDMFEYVSSDRSERRDALPMQCRCGEPSIRASRPDYDP